MSFLPAKRNPNIDILRITAISMIVLAHVVVAVYERPDFFGGTAWMVSLVAITFSRLGVPLFLLISGYLLVQKERSFSQNIIHTWKRLLFPCLFWSVITYVGLYVSQKQIPVFNSDTLLVSGGTTYYFLIGLAIIYLLNPSLKALTKSISYKQIRSLLLILAISTVGQTTATFIKHTSPFNIFDYWFLCLFYFMYGQYRFLYKRNKNKASFLLNLSLFIIPLLVNLVYIYVVRLRGFTQNLLVESYFGPTVLLSSIGLFNTMMDINFQNLGKRLRNLLISLANASFGVYLIHGIVLDLILHKTLFNPYGMVKINLLIYLVIATILTMEISLFLSLILSKNNYAKITLGER